MPISKAFVLFISVAALAGCQTWPGGDLDDRPAPAAGSEPGKVYVSYWDNVEGASISDLTSVATFPDDPDQVLPIYSLQGPRERGSAYGARVRGFIEPPIDGEYRFYISSDDQSELYLSPTNEEADKELIASVTGWTNVEEYDKYASQASSVTVLEAGQRYYFEVLFKERWGGDHFTVAWEGPGFARSTIPGDALHSWAPPSELPEDTTTSRESYNLGYRVGFLDASENLAFNPDYPPLDEDGDGLYDNWEVVNGLDPTNPDDAGSDPDGDFLSASEEFLIGTTENLADTDGDGIPDGAEFAMELDPLDANDAQLDLDNDGYTNLQEYQAGTDIRSEADKPEAPKIAYLSGFAGQYFSGTEFNELVFVRTDSDVDFAWGRTGAPPGLPADEFSVRWASEFIPPHTSGTRAYRFTVSSDDGVRLYLNGDLVIDQWQGQAVTTFTHDAELTAGEPVTVTMEYFEGRYDATISLSVTDLQEGTGVSATEAFRAPDPSVTSTVDSDGDGMPDTWELSYGTQVWTADAGQVLNTAGVTNLEAYESGLIPRTLEPVDGETETSPGSEEPVTGGASVTLTWTAPSTRVDGESIALSEIQSYIVRYGRVQGELDQQVTVDSTETSYQFDNLESGTWYFAVQVVDINGLVSELSEVIEHNVP